MRWILYSRNECPLCEYAANILRTLKVEFTEVDIDASDSLVSRYGVQVPVIRDAHHKRELGFPFEPADVAEFVGADTDGQS